MDNPAVGRDGLQRWRVCRKSARGFRHEENR
jgi:hypothetical protein